MPVLVLNGRYYNPKDVADLLGCSVVTVNHWVRRNLIIPVHINDRAYIIPESEVERIRKNPPKMGRPRTDVPQKAVRNRSQ